MTLRKSFLLTCLLGLALMTRLPAEDTPPAAVEPPLIGATVLGKEIDLNKIVYPLEVEEKRQTLPAAKFDTWLRSHQVERLFWHIKMPVMQDYVTREKLSPSDEELNKLIQDAQRKYPENFDTTDEEAKRKLGLEAWWMLGSTKDWRLARALHQKYGGRVAISSFGAFESFEGRNAVLKEYFDRGDIKFHQADLQQAFFEKMKDERIQDVTLSPERSTELFKEPSPLENWLVRQAVKNAEIKAERKANPQPAPAPPK